MTLTSDLEVLKDIPGYKAILKAVLKSQIQFLVEQLSDHTGEESLLLTACVTDGSLSHLGSNTGRNFIEGHDDVRTMFLSHCLKTGQMVDADEDSDTSIDEPVPVTLHETVSSTVKVESIKQGTPRQQLLAETRRLMVAQPTTPKPEVTPASRMAQRLGVKRSTSAAEASASPAKAVRVTPAAGHPGTETGGGDLAVAGTSMGEGHPTRAATAGGSAKPCKPTMAGMGLPEINGHQLSRIPVNVYGRRARRLCGVCNPAEREELAKIGIVKKRPGRESSYECSECNTTLCRYPCFKIYHTNKDFKKAYRRFKRQLQYDKRGVYSDDSDDFSDEDAAILEEGEIAGNNVQQ